MRAQGMNGELRASYHVAARLGQWTMESIPTLPVRRYAVTAQVYDFDAYWITQPVALVLYIGRESWVWTPDRTHLRDLADSVLLQVLDRPVTIKEVPCPHSILMTLIRGSANPRPSSSISNGSAARSTS